MKKLFVLTILIVIIKIFETTKIINITDDNSVAADTFNLNLNNFNKIFRCKEFITISIENHLLFAKVLQLFSANKTYFVIDNKYCFNSIYNVETNSFINAYYEIDEVLGQQRRKRDIITRGTDDENNDRNVTFNDLTDLSIKNDGGFIFEINTLDIFNYIIDCYLTPGGTFLFIIINRKTMDYVYEDYFMDEFAEDDISLHDITTIFNDIWIKHQNYKIFIYFNQQIITYNPFYYNFTAQRYGKLIVNASDSSDHSEFLSEINLKNLNGYPVKIELFPSPYVREVVNEKTKKKHFVGADIQVANTLSKVMNYTGAKVSASFEQFGYRLPNGTLTGTLKHLTKHLSDVAINGFFIKDYLTRDIEFTVGVYADQACLILPKANRIPSSLLPLLCFKIELWLLILLVIIGCALFWCLIRWINNTKNFDRTMQILDHKPYQYCQIFMDTLSLMGSAPLRQFTKVPTERCFIITLCLLSLVFVSIFQSNLATVFIEPLYYKDILTLLDMANSEYKIVVKYPAMMDDVFPPNSTKLIEQLRTKLFILDQKLIKITVDIAQKKKLAWVTRRTKAKLDNAIFITNQTYFLVPECPKMYNLAYVVAKDSVYLEPINDILQHMISGGIIDKWVNDMYFNQTLLDIRTYGIFYVEKFKTLTVLDLQLAFILLALGILISVALFVIELNIKRCCNVFRKFNKELK